MSTYVGIFMFFVSFSLTCPVWLKLYARGGLCMGFTALVPMLVEGLCMFATSSREGSGLDLALTRFDIWCGDCIASGDPWLKSRWA